MAKNYFRMKKSLSMVVAAMMATMNVNAQDVQPYFELDQMPKLIKIMPAPPAFDSPELQMMWFAMAGASSNDRMRSA